MTKTSCTNTTQPPRPEDDLIVRLLALPRDSRRAALRALIAGEE